MSAALGTSKSVVEVRSPSVLVTGILISSLCLVFGVIIGQLLMTPGFCYMVSGCNHLHDVGIYVDHRLDAAGAESVVGTASCAATKIIATDRSLVTAIELLVACSFS